MLIVKKTRVVDLTILITGSAPINIHRLMTVLTNIVTTATEYAQGSTHLLILLVVSSVALSRLITALYL